MGKMIFIPLTDKILYEQPDLVRNRLVPYKVGVSCYHWLKEANAEIEYADGSREVITEHAA
jgi:hypothetical protein